MPFDIDITLAPWLALLLDVSIKGTLVLGLAGVVALVLHRASAATRHLVWCVALVSLLVLPVLTVIVPAWEVPLQGFEAVALPEQRFAEATPLAPDSAAPLVPLGTFDVENPVSSAASVVAAAAAPRRSLDLADVLLVVWGMGMLAIFGRLLIGRVGVWWLARQGRRVTDAGVQRTARTLARQLAVRRPVMLLESPQASGPMTWGVRRPMLLLPADAADWPAERQRAVLLHELAHVQRWDWLTQTLAHVVRAVYWFNPLVWLATRQLIAEQEAACDDAVLAGGTPAPQYAHHLLEIARAMRPVGWPVQAAPGMARWSSLEHRLRDILAPRSRRALSRRVVTGAGIGGFLLITPLAALHPQTKPRAADPSENVPLPTFTIIKEAAPAAQEALQPDPAPTSIPEPEAVPETSPAEEPAATPQTAPERAPMPESPTAHADSALVRALIRALQDEHPDIRAQAAMTLGEIESPLAIEPLVVALRDPVVEVREHVVWALGQMGDGRAADGLVVAIRDDEASVRERAAWALGQIADPRAVPALTAALRDENSAVREQAVWALGQIESPDAVHALREALRDDSAEVREQVAWALGQISSPMATDDLIVALRDEQAGVRKMAAWALGQIEDTSAIDALSAAMSDSDVEVRKMAIWALGQIAD